MDPDGARDGPDGRGGSQSPSPPSRVGRAVQVVLRSGLEGRFGGPTFETWAVEFTQLGAGSQPVWGRTCQGLVDTYHPALALAAGGR